MPNDPAAGADERRLGDRDQFITALDLTKRYSGQRILAVLVDLGGLERGTRVSRILGPGYADGIRARSIERIAFVIGWDVALYLVENDCIAFVVSDQPDWTTRLERLVTELQAPLISQQVPAMVPAVVAAVKFTAAAAAPHELLRQAFIAAVDARESGVSLRFVEFDAQPAGDRARTILTSLMGVFQSGQLSLAYQPRIDLATRDCLGAEALLRWMHPELGAVSPAEFVPLLEQTGLAGEMTAWVARQAIADLADWQRDGFGHGVSINVSVLNLQEPGFAARLGDAVSDAGVEPRLLEVEFTEGALIQTNGYVRGNIDELARIGVTIAIDDFGTGYSNLHYLRDIPARVLKIDQSFIRFLTDNPRDPVIVRSMIELSHTLGHRVVAEGIETEAALDLLTAWGCDEGQGFFIARPAPLASKLTWLRTRSGTAGPPA